jgi:acyl-CoA thioester hydrolase
MARIKIELPSQFPFSTRLPVRITDINYGGHVGNDAILSLLHEARMQFLQHLGYTEMNLSGAAIIMSDVAIEFKGETFYGDTLIAYVSVAGITKAGFDIIYRLEKETPEQHAVLVAKAKTGMVCFNYALKKIATLPEEVLEKLASLT